MKTPEEMAKEYTNQFSWNDPREEDAHDAFVAGYKAAQPQWISVKERLPEYSCCVLWLAGRNGQWKGKVDVGECDTSLTMHSGPEIQEGCCEIGFLEKAVDGPFSTDWVYSNGWDWAERLSVFSHWMPLLPEPKEEEK